MRVLQYGKMLLGLFDDTEAPPGKEKRLLDYGRLEGDVLYHGTISDLDGTPKSTWTYEEHGAPVTREQSIEDKDFQLLWHGLDHFDIFHQTVAFDPDALVDPLGHHVIGATFLVKGQPQHRMFQVPTDTMDPDFLQWLAALNVPFAQG